MVKYKDESELEAANVQKENKVWKAYKKNPWELLLKTSNLSPWNTKKWGVGQDFHTVLQIW